MCGRFTREYTWREVHDFLNFLSPEMVALERSWNVAPTQESLIARAGAEGGREGALARWGLVPAWADDPSIGSRMINARSETVATSRAFRDALAHRRCVVPISAFYEWQRVEGERRRRPWAIRRADGGIMLLAGLWARWPGRGGADPIESFTIITTAASEFVSRLHDRMPAVLEPEGVGAWLERGTSPEAARAMLGPAAEGVLVAHRVGTAVNSPRAQGPELVREVEDAPADGPTGGRAGRRADGQGELFG